MEVHRMKVDPYEFIVQTSIDCVASVDIGTSMHSSERQRPLRVPPRTNLRLAERPSALWLVRRDSAKHDPAGLVHMLCAVAFWWREQRAVRFDQLDVAMLNQTAV